MVVIRSISLFLIPLLVIIARQSVAASKPAYFYFQTDLEPSEYHVEQANEFFRINNPDAKIPVPRGEPRIGKIVKGFNYFEGAEFTEPEDLVTEKKEEDVETEDIGAIGDPGAEEESPEQPKPRCPEGNNFQAIFLNHENNCSKFYICAHGIAHELNCPPGLFFNSVNQICDWPANVNCVINV